MSDNYPANPVTIGEHIKKTRMEKGLLQEDVAKLFGVSTDTITNWENERGIPQIQFFPKIIAFLGYHPFLAEPKTLGERIKRYRELHGLSHKKMGKLVGVDVPLFAAGKAR